MDELSNAFRQFNPDKDGNFESSQVEEILTNNSSLDWGSKAKTSMLTVILNFTKISLVNF